MAVSHKPMSDEPQSPLPAPTALCRVLLAEDNQSNALLADVALRHFRCDVRLVTDGESAVAVATTEPFDIVFMDYHMPVMDGLHATEAIRRFEAAHQRRRMPIVAITASAMPSERDRCLAAGMDDVLVKPFVLGELERMLLRWTQAQTKDKPRG
jgi:CheY-like chemotaxis protein